MKILLINPTYLKEIKNDDHLSLPLGLLTIASYVKKYRKDLSISIVDMELEKRSKRTFDEVLKTLGADFDIIGITDHYANFSNALKIAEKVRSLFPQSLIVLGGVHATACHKEIIDNFIFVDAVVRGEGEKPLLQIIENIYSEREFHKDVHAITYRENGRTVLNADGSTLNLNTAPPVNYSFINIGKYLRDPLFSSSQWVESGRGCSGRCTFCSSSVRWRNSVRYLSLKKILSDIKQLQSYGIKDIKFTHDNIFSDESFVKELCTRLRKNTTRIKWSCYARLNDLTSNVLNMISSAGCKSIFVGFETSSRQIQAQINKTYDRTNAIKLVLECKKVGIEVNGNFIFNLPGADTNSIDKDLAFALKLKQVGAGNIQFSCLKLMPGSVLYEKLSKRKIRLRHDFNYNLKCSISTKNKLFSFFINNGCQNIRGVPVWVVGEIANFLIEYFPFTTHRLTISKSHSPFDIVKKIYVANRKLFNGSYSDLSLYKCAERFIRKMCEYENDSLLTDLCAYDTAINNLSFGKNKRNRITFGTTHDIMQYTEDSVVHKLVNRERVSVKIKDDKLLIMRGGCHEAHQEAH